MAKTVKSTGLEPPAHLSPTSAALWRDLVVNYDLKNDKPAQVLLTIALSAMDRAAEARVAIARDGPTVRDRYGQSRAHPMLLVERQSQAQAIRAMHELGFDVVGERDGPGRPPFVPGMLGSRP